MPPGEVTIEQQPSHLEVFGDYIVTFRGVTGSLTNLAQLCPVPENERDPAKQREWTQNILEESGIDKQTQSLVLEHVASDLAQAQPPTAYAAAKKK